MGLHWVYLLTRALKGNEAQNKFLLFSKIKLIMKNDELLPKKVC